VKPAIREQTANDTEKERWSEISQFDTGADTPTRQEFKDEADTSIMLQKFGVLPGATSRPLVWGGEEDFDMDLQTATEAVRALRHADMRVPPELKDKYPTWRHLLNGVETGEYQQDLKNLADKKATTGNKPNKKSGEKGEPDEAEGVTPIPD